jgi:hypothetical protein
MIRTEQQRRWWFATHPEFSWGRSGVRTGGQEWQSSFGHPSDKNESKIDSIAHELELLQQATERDEMGLEADPHTALDLMPYRRFVTSPFEALKDLFRSSLRDAVLSAAKRGESKGPGDWVEVGRRGGPSLEHQSRMSGQPVRENGGKYRINEYDVNGTKFDDYKDGKLYEYKGYHGHLFNKNDEFHSWVDKPSEFRDEALRQVKAAQGIPVVWRVGREQVEAFRKAVGRIPGLSIEP